MDYRMMFRILIFVIMGKMSVAVSTAWRPIPSGQLDSSILHQEAAVFGGQSNFGNYDESALSQQILQEQDQCALYKVGMVQQLYFEYIHYKINMPDIKEFTLCAWTKFINHTNDHPLFSYAVGDQPRGILSWISNTQRSSYYMMNIDGHNLYRLNYPLRLNKWYHSCQSWNGRTGEWQVWVNDERVGRGFNNRLVGHVIKGGGVAISGQEQRQLGGGFLEGPDAPIGSGGMLGELTMLQLYSVALTAGKAHKDHKHHHAHHFEHDTSNRAPLSTTKPPITGPPLPMHPFITAGQINHQVKLNPGTNIQILQNGVTLRHPSVPIPKIQMPYPPINPTTELPPLSQSTIQPLLYTPTNNIYGKRFPSLISLSTTESTNDYGYIDGQYHNLYKRDKNLIKRMSNDEEITDTVDKFESTKRIIKRNVDNSKLIKLNENNNKTLVKRDSDKIKRGLLQLSDGSVIDDTYIVSQNLNNDYFSGLKNFGIETMNNKNSNKKDEREPAEAEVKAVMDVCDGCIPDPFEKALIMDWRTVPKKIYSGALWIPANPTCKSF